MIKVTEKRFYRKINQFGLVFDKQEIRRITVWFLFIPVFIKENIVSGSIEY